MRSICRIALDSQASWPIQPDVQPRRDAATDFAPTQRIIRMLGDSRPDRRRRGRPGKRDLGRGQERGHHHVTLRVEVLSGTGARLAGARPAQDRVVRQGCTPVGPPAPRSGHPCMLLGDSEGATYQAPHHSRIDPRLEYGRPGRPRGGTPCLRVPVRSCHHRSQAPRQPSRPFYRIAPTPYLMHLLVVIAIHELIIPKIRVIWPAGVVIAVVTYLGIGVSICVAWLFHIRRA